MQKVLIALRVMALQGRQSAAAGRPMLVRRPKALRKWALLANIASFLAGCCPAGRAKGTFSQHVDILGIRWDGTPAGKTGIPGELFAHAKRPAGGVGRGPGGPPGSAPPRCLSVRFDSNTRGW